MRNPLSKRIPRELLHDWHKYAVIIVFMIFMIGAVSAMYIGHDSMMAALTQTVETGNLEDGRFETDRALTEEEIAAIETGEMADVRANYLEEAYEEADREIDEAAQEALEEEVRSGIEQAVRDQCALYGITDEEMIAEQIHSALSDNYESALEEARASDEYREALEETRSEAYARIEETVEEEWGKVADRYDLDEEGFEAVPTEITEHFYRDMIEDIDRDGHGDATVRLYMSDAQVDLATFLDGRAPENAGEIAIDRMHADNVGLAVGDIITVGDRDFEIVGLLAYVNYSTLHEKNTDLIFDAFGFDVAMVTPEAFDLLEGGLHYNYVFMYEEEPADDIAEADASKRLLKALITQLAITDAELEDYVPEYASQSSNFAESDIEGDTAASKVLIYVLIAVIAFIFAITISTIIDREAAVIGTLRATGYKRSEMVMHYMSMPIVVTLIGAALGNLLGYTVFKDAVVDLYYNSYSLPTCSTVFGTTAFIQTTLIPLLLMLVINFTVISYRLRLSPLKFLRRDLKKSRRTKAIRLPSWSFMKRFRLRILLQNIPNYLILVFGVIFIEVMLSFAFGFPDSLAHYAEEAPEMVFASYQYMLTSSEDEDGEKITTEAESAERFSATTLVQERVSNGRPMRGANNGGESITVYGYVEDSRYIDIAEDPESGSVYVSSAYADKYELREGSRVTLSEKYENQFYVFRVAGVFDYDGGIAVFMPIEAFNTVFDREEDDFTGYFSEEEITDIPAKYIANVLTAEDVTKITTQMQHSVGGFMNILKYALLVMSVALIYLLSKVIIEKNEQSISMAKILGFKNGEIASLYMLPTAGVVLVFTIISFFIGRVIILEIFKIFLMLMDGWFTYYISPGGIAGSILFVLIGYALVSVADYIRIRRIPMDVALKNVE